MKDFSLLLFVFSFTLSCAQSDSKQVESGRSVFTDPRDQQDYPVVKMGEQFWMATDLKFATAKSVCYQNVEENRQQYGRLYPLEEAKKACPDGWHLPNDEEWKKLEKHLGMTDEQVDGFRVWRGETEGEKMKQQLQIVYAGIEEDNATKFLAKDRVVRYWVNTQGPSGAVFSIYRMLMNNESRIYSDQITKKNFLCVRCVRDK